MKKLLVVYSSMTGGSAQMARVAADAARSNVEVHLQTAVETRSAEVLAADGYIFVSPENLGSMAGLMKDFFDRVYYDALDQINGRPYALLVCAGSDGTGVIRQVERIATGLRLKAIAPPLIIITHAQTRETILAAKHIAEEDLRRCADVGAAFAEGLAAGIF
ncbi:MAG: flavodoxin family protein [Burkholderiaceae bacterium]|nr:MAG: flavodoxin family protein [Burkholderiaceae bacterium]